MSMTQPIQAIERSTIQCLESCLYAQKLLKEVESEQMNRTALRIPFAFELKEEARQRTSLLRAAPCQEFIRTKKPHSHLVPWEIC